VEADLVATTLSSKLGYYVAWVTKYCTTLNALGSLNGIKSPVAAYDPMMLVLNEESCESHAIATYLENPLSRHVDVLLGCIADIGFEPPTHLVHCMVGLLHSKDEKIVNCAILALLAGGEYATNQLNDTIEKQNLTHVNSFIRVYSELL